MVIITNSILSPGNSAIYVHREPYYQRSRIYTESASRPRIVSLYHSLFMHLHERTRFGPFKRSSYYTPICSWFNNNAHPSATGFLKAGHMQRPDLSILPYITRYWQDLKPYVLRLIETCFLENPGQPNHLTHDKMVSILREAFEAVEEPQKTGSKRSLPLEDVRQSKKGKQ